RSSRRTEPRRPATRPRSRRGSCGGSSPPRRDRTAGAWTSSPAPARSAPSARSWVAATSSSTPTPWRSRSPEPAFVSAPRSSDLPLTLTRERCDLQYVVVVDPALQGFLIGLAPTLVSAGFAVRLARLKNNLEAELHERIARVDRQLNAEELLTRYREPLAGAAFDL